MFENIKNMFGNNSQTVENRNDGIITSIFGGFGKQNRRKAEKISALHSGIGLIADSIAALPIHKYKINKDGSKTKIECKESHLLNNSMNNITNAYTGKNMMIKDSIFNGNGYILIERDKDFKVKELIPLDSDSVTLLFSGTGKDRVYHYQITHNGQSFRKEYYEVINLCGNSIDGVMGRGILEYGSEVLGLASSQNHFQGSVIENGAFTKGVLYVPSEVKGEERQKLADKLKGFFSKGNSGKLLVLPKDSEYKSISMTPADLDLLKAQEFTIQEIARLLKIRPELLGASISSGNYKNLEESNIQFLQFTLQPYLINIEQTLNHFLLTEVEKESGEYCFCFDTSGIKTIGAKDQMEILDKAISGGVLTIKEARNKLNMPYVEGTDILLMSKFNSGIVDGKIVNFQSASVVGEKNEDKEINNE